MLIGYMRVSTGEQSLDLQRDALARVGCERVYDDVCSGRAPQGSRMNLSGDDLEHVVVVPGGFLASAA